MREYRVGWGVSGGRVSVIHTLNSHIKKRIPSKLKSIYIMTIVVANGVMWWEGSRTEEAEQYSGGDNKIRGLPSALPAAWRR